MTIDELREQGLIILECISGSKVYGLDTPDSDTDIKGVFMLPKAIFFGLNYIPQVSNESNDIVFYEFGRFMELLSQNNPNILELLSTPEQAVLYRHPLLEAIRPGLFLSKLCRNTFGKFALSQIRKARGLNKKILNPLSGERKSVLNFCYVNYGQGAVPLQTYLEIKGWQQEQCGLVNIPHMKDIYGLYHSEEPLFNGIARSHDANEVCLSPIPKDHSQVALLYFNRDGYSTYCKEYREYQDWVERRNETRYENTQRHGKNYDTKNMMHVFRLLEMAIEIGREKKINVRRPDRDFLLEIKTGKYAYDELLNRAADKQLEMEKAFEQADLPEKPDIERINELTWRIRDRFYSQPMHEGSSLP